MPAATARCSAIGPRASTGKKSRPPTIRITPISRTTNSEPGGGKGAGGRRRDLLGDQSAGDRHRRNDDDEASEQHRHAQHDVVVEGVGGEAGEGRAVVAGRRGIGVEDLAEPVRPRILHAGQHPRAAPPPARAAEDGQREDQDGEHRQLHLLGGDLLAEILRRSPDHQSGDEHRQDDEDQHAVEAGADAAEDHLAQHHVDHRHHAAQRREAVVHGVDRAVRGVGGRRRPQRRQNRAEADLLALHVAAGRQVRGGLVDGKLGEGGIGAGLGPAGDGEAAGEQHEHGEPDGQRLAQVADHPAERVDEARGDHQDEQRLDQVGDRGRVLVGMRRVDVEEAAAVRSQHLDGDLARHRTLGDDLLRALPASSR